MPKHRLFTSVQESPNLNSSRDEANTEAPKSKEKEHANKDPNGAQRPEKNSNPTVQPHSLPKPGGEVRNEKIQHADNNKNVNQLHSRPVSVCVSESESDSMDEIDFFSKGNSNVKLPYTLQEDEFIIKYVLKGQNIFRASSVSLWKFLESKKENPKRTYQSLKNRFLKSIKPRLFTTYSYLIKDKETERIILEKYPDLKKKGVKKDIFSALNLPRRPGTVDFSDDDINPSVPVVSSAARNSSNQNQNNIINHANEKNSEQRKTAVSDTQKKNRIPGIEVTHSREVTIRKDRTIVTVKFKESLPKVTSTLPRVGIYSKFIALKNQNNLVPCPTCSKLGFKSNGIGKNPDDSDSDSDGDNFIPNSVETPSESNSKTPPESNSARKSLPTKEVEKSPNNLNSRKSKNSSKELGNSPKKSKNSNPRDSQNSPATKGSKTVPVNSNTSNLQNNISSKELKQLLEDSYSQKILKNMLSKEFSANKKRKITSTSQNSDKSPQRTSNSSSQQQQQSNLQNPPSRNLRKSVRKRVVKKLSNDIKVNNIATRKQPRRNLDTSKTTTTTTTPTVAELGSGSKPNGRPYLDRRAKKSTSYSRQVKKPKKKLKAYKLPLRIGSLTHRERFILRKVLRRTYRLYRMNLLENKKKGSKTLKKNLKKNQVNNRKQKETNSKSQSESDSLNDNYSRSLYKETVSKCQKLVNSDEERRPEQNEVRSDTRRQNVVHSQDVDCEALKYFFMDSDTELSNSCTQNTKSDLDDSACSSLAENMMKMLSRF